MPKSQKLIRAKLSLLELGDLFKNTSDACRVMGVSRQHFYDIKKTYEKGGIGRTASRLEIEDHNARKDDRRANHLILREVFF